MDKQVVNEWGRRMRIDDSFTAAAEPKELDELCCYISIDGASHAEMGCIECGELMMDPNHLGICSCSSCDRFNFDQIAH